MADDEDAILMKEILATHAPTPDGQDQVHVMPLFHIVEDIISHAIENVDSVGPASQTLFGNLKHKTYHASVSALLDSLSVVTQQIIGQIESDSLGGVNAHETTVSLFKMLSKYSWDAKLGLTLVAFAMNNGEYWLLTHVNSSYQLPRSLAILKQLPLIMEHLGPRKAQFDELRNFNKLMLDVTRFIFQFKELPFNYYDDISAAKVYIPTAVYWIIKSVVACQPRITSLAIKGGLEYGERSTPKALELSNLTQKLYDSHSCLIKLMALCLQHLEEKGNNKLDLNQLFDMNRLDNITLVKALIYPHLLLVGSTREKINIDVLRGKNVLLLLSTLDSIDRELYILIEIYEDSKRNTGMSQNQFEVVWIPIIDESVQWTDLMQTRFDSLQSSMPWCTMHHPSLIDQTLFKFIKKMWRVGNKPTLVMLDQQGRVVCPNAIHMIWIWASFAFPFTSLREKALWREETWRLELLVDGIDPVIFTWIREGKYIFLYGGDNIDWIRKFTTTARDVARAAGIPLEMVYVGKGSTSEQDQDQIRKILRVIDLEKLSHSWPDLMMIWFFWSRLESMLFSIVQQAIDLEPLVKRKKDLEHMTQEIKKLVTYDRAGGWGLLSKGSDMVINAHRSTILPTLMEYDLWKENVPTMGFDASIKNHHDKFFQNVTHPCCCFEISNTARRIPENMNCPECFGPMEKFITYQCYHN